jgi:hypothetical protein
LVRGPREVTEALWNICCAAAVATSLTGSFHRSEWCHQSDRCKFPLCDLVCFGSEGCLLVLRISSTLVATWSCFSLHLLREEFLSLPIYSPLFGSLYRSFNLCQSRLRVLIDSNQSKIQGWRTRNGVRVLHTSMAKTTRCGLSGVTPQVFIKYKYPI